MARTNKCKFCGVTELPDGASWIGTNHNLCSSCVTKSDTFQKSQRGYSTAFMTHPLAMMAAAMIPPARRR